MPKNNQKGRMIQIYIVGLMLLITVLVHINFSTISTYAEEKTVGNTTTTIKYADTGKTEIFTAPYDGYYTFELYGGSSAIYTECGSKGGYASGKIYLKEGTKLYIYAGTYNDQTTANEATYIAVNGTSISNRVAIASGGGYASVTYHTHSSSCNAHGIYTDVEGDGTGEPQGDPYSWWAHCSNCNTEIHVYYDPTGEYHDCGYRNCGKTEGVSIDSSVYNPYNGASSVQSSYTYNGTTYSISDVKTAETQNTGAGYATITYYNYYTMTLYYNRGTYNSNSSKEYTVVYNSTNSNDISSELPTRAGYTFNGFYTESTGGTQIYNSSGKITNDGTYWKSSKWNTTSDVTFYAQWTAATNIKYTVKHWQQNVNGTASSQDSNNYTLVKTENFTGSANASISPDTQSYTGFTSPAVEQTSISPDGSTVINYYYTRNSYTLTVKPNSGTWNGTSSNSTITMLYGETKTIANPTRSQYAFSNWAISGTGASLSGTTFTMGSSDAILTANWTSVTTNTVVVNQTSGGSGTYTADYSGIYLVEIYGASGGGASSKSEGGYGGYISAKIKVKKGTNIDWIAGAQGSLNGSSSYGQGGSASNGGYSGGGYSRISISGTPLLVAGGGGGRSGYSVPSSRILTSGTLSGFGGSLSAGSLGVIAGMHTNPPDGIFGTQHSTTSTTQWQGGSASSGAGGGGGGYYAGTAGDEYYAGGGGGISYYYSGSSYTVYDVNELYGQNLGSGIVKITYLGTYDVTVTIILSNNGTISGVQDTLAYQVTMSKSCDTSIILPAVTTKDSENIKFTGYTQVYGDGTVKQNSDGTYTLNSGMEGITIQANYTSTGISFTYTQSGKNVNLQWSDTAATFYVLKSGVDVSSANVQEDFDTENSEQLYTVADSDKEISSTYTVKASGYYTLQLWGGKGYNAGHGDGQGSHSKLWGYGGNGSYATASVYLKKGDVLTKVTYSGGGGASNGHSGCNSGQGGYGVGLLLNGTTIMAAGGGGGGNTCYKNDGGEVHFDASDGGSGYSAYYGSTSGQSGWKEGIWISGADEYWYVANGGGGGGYPNGGGRVSEASSAGRSYIASTVNGKATQNNSIQTNANGSTSTTIKIKMAQVAGGTQQTSGTYTLYDRKAPYTPNAASVPYKENTSAANGTYIVYWQATTDQGSTNMFQVTSYDAYGAELHKSAVYTVTYASGLKEYQVSTDGVTYKSVGTALQASGYSAGQTIYIRAVDNSNNHSEPLAITIPGVMTISYNLNNTTNNVNGMPYSSNATGSIPGVTLKSGQSAIVTGNGGEMSRTGYYHSTDSTQKQYWVGSDGKTYHVGDEITYVANKKLILYAQWTPITYTVNLHQNKPSDSDRSSGQIGSHAVTNKVASSSTDWTLVTTNSADIYYTKTFVYDSTTLNGPSTFFSLTGWSLNTNTKWYETKGSNGAASGTTHEAYSTAQNHNLTSTNGTVFNFYPYWVKNSYTIKYDSNTGNNNIFSDAYTTTPTGTVANTSCSYDTDVTITSSQYTREGYTFVGWSTSSAWGSGQTNLDTWNTTRNNNQDKSNYHSTYKYSDSDLFVSGQTLFKPNFKDGTTGKTEITLYAVWEPITYTIKFNENKGTENKMSDMIVRFDQSIALNQLNITRKYSITYKNAEPWETDLKSQNGNTNSASTTVSYSFLGWSQGSAIGSTPYYEFTGTVTGSSSATGVKSSSYQVTSFTSSNATLLKDKATIKNLYGGTRNDPTKNIVTLYATWKGGTTTIAGAVTGKNNYTFVDWSDTPYVDTRLYDGKINNNKDAVNASVGKGVTYKPYKDTTFYAHWKKTATLVFNLNGGNYKDATSSIKTQGVYYDYENGYTFGILNNMTQQSKGKYDTQTVTIDGSTTSKLVTKVDAYSSYDSNGINKSYFKIDNSTGCTYRLLGWTYSKANSTIEGAVPSTDSVTTGTTTKGNYEVYSSSKTSKVNITDTTNLYAVWEPVLQLDFTLDRTLGSTNSSDTTRQTSLTAVSSLSDRTLSITADAGNQLTYQVMVPSNFTSLTTTKPTVTVEFDKDASGNTYSKESGLSLLAIYDSKNAKWCDKLNPSTTEDLVANQTSGLNRTFKTNNQVESRTFYIPQYLGTSQSYNTANKGQTLYHAVATISKPSYYWNKVKGKDETIKVDLNMNLKLSSSNTGNGNGNGNGSGTGSGNGNGSGSGSGSGNTDDETKSLLKEIKTTMN